MRSTRSADRFLDRLFHKLVPELARRAVAQRFVRVDRIVMAEPRIELAQHAVRVGLGADACVIPLDGFDEGFGHAIRLWALDRCRARNQPDVASQGTRLSGSVGRAIVRQPFDRLGQFVDQPETALDAFDHQIADVRTVDAAGCRHPGDRLAVAAVEREGNPHFLAVVAADLKAVRAPARIGAVDRHATVMPPFLTGTGVACQQEAMRLHHPVDPFDIHRRTALFVALTPQQCMDAPVSVGRLAGDQCLDLSDKLCLGLWGPAPPPTGPLQAGLHGEIGAGDTQGIGDRLHSVSSRTGDSERNSRFFGCTNSSASRSTSFSKVFLPSRRCNSRTWCCNARYSEAGTTSSPAPTADSAPSA